MTRYDDTGNEFYTKRLLEFARPFVLGSAPEVYPAGTYEVESRHEVLDLNGHGMARRMSTVLVVPTPAGTLHRNVSGTELDNAFAQDAQQSTPGDRMEKDCASE